MNKKSIILLLVAVFLLSLTGCTHKQVSEAPELLEPAGYTMDTAVVERGRVAFKRYFTGEIVPDVQEAAFTTGGKLERLTVTYGDVVKEGDVLAILDLSEVEEQVEDLTWQMEYQAKTNALTLDQLQLEVDSSQSALNELYANGVPWSGRRMQSLDLEEKELKLQQTKEDQALDMERSEAQLKTLKKSLESRELKAPCSGRIVYVDPAAKEGKTIADYETVFCITDDSLLYAITDSISDSLRTSCAPAPGVSSTAWICIETGIREDVLRIPANALYLDESSSYVYVVEEGRRTRRNIQVGVKTDIMIEVTEGLEEGETVYVQE